MNYFIKQFTTFSRWSDNSKIYINIEQCFQTDFGLFACMPREVVEHTLITTFN